MPDGVGTARLDVLLKSATVRIQGADGAYWGSGFLVAPGWVLTAAHVLRSRLGGRPGQTARFTVVLPDEFGGERQLPARLGYWPHGMFAYDTVPEECDLALVRLLEQEAEHPCVWLSDRVEPPEGGLKAYGWYEKPSRPDGTHGGGPGVLSDWDGRFDYSGTDGWYALRLGPPSEMPHGVSGGPVVDLHSRAVVALVKRNSTGSRGEVRPGGLAVRTALLGAQLATLQSAEAVCPDGLLGPSPYAELMRRHDRWHADTLGTAAGAEFGWHRVHTEAPGYAGAYASRGPQQAAPAAALPSLNGTAEALRWSPADRMTLLGLLGRLPEPDSPVLVAKLLKAALYDSLGRLPPVLHTLRDGHGCLYRDDFSYPALPFLRYARLAALLAERLAQRLAAAGDDTAGRTAEAVRAADAVRAWLQERIRPLPLDRREQIQQTELPEWLLREVDGPEPDGPEPDTGTAPGVARGRDASTDPVVQLAGTHPGDEEATVVLELEPALWSDRPAFYAYLRVQNGAELRGYDEYLEPEGGIPHDRLVEWLREPLRRRFGEVDTVRRKAPLEVALPLDHFDLPVQRWMLHDVAQSLDGSDPAYLPLGAQRQVVVRALDRRPEADPDPDAAGGSATAGDVPAAQDDAWVRRWAELGRVPGPETVRVPPPGSPLRAEQLAATAAGAVPALCRPVADGTGAAGMALALEHGHGIVLWSTAAHPGTGCGDTCDALHEGLAKTVRGVGAARQLPEHIRVLRARIHRRDDAARWAGALAILYDDATRPLPAADGTVDSP